MSKANIWRYRSACLTYCGALFLPVALLVILNIIVTQDPTRQSRHPYLVALGVLVSVASVSVILRLRQWGRTQLRYKYGIQGSECSDCLAVACSSRWALAQEARHVQHHSRNPDMPLS